MLIIGYLLSSLHLLEQPKEYMPHLYTTITKQIHKKLGVPNDFHICYVRPIDLRKEKGQCCC